MKLTKTFFAIAIIAAFSLIVAACGDDDDNSSTPDPVPDTTAAPAEPAPDTTAAAPDTTAAPAEPAPDTTAAAPDTTAAVEEISCDMDSNGDGVVRFGIATAGPRDDGAYYQALVESIEEFSAADPCYGDPIIVDNIQAAEAATELENLAQQGVDIIAVGASEIAEPLDELTEQYEEIFWYCNCGAGYPPLTTLAQSQDDASEILYTAGFATGLLLQERGGNSAAFIGCCDLDFEQEAYLAYELGLQAVDEDFTMTYTATGNFPFDFDNTQGAIEALEASIQQGVDAVNPYLGGAHEPLVQLANEEGLIVMSAGASNVCEREDLNYDIAVRFDAGDYIETILDEIAAGNFNEGDVRIFKVGIDSEPGAVICDPTPDQQADMDFVYRLIADGDFAGVFGAIKGQAYAQ